MMLTLAMNNIAKIQDTIISKPKISNCCSMSNMDFKTNGGYRNNNNNDNDYDEYEFDSNEIIRNKTLLPEPMPKRPKYDDYGTEINTNTNINNCETPHLINALDKKLLYTLKTLDLECLYNVFINHSISFNDLFLLTKEDLIEMRITIGPRNRLLHFGDEYRKIAKDYDAQELNEFFCNNKWLAINQIDFNFNSNDENKIKVNNRNKDIIQSYFHTNCNNNNNNNNNSNTNRNRNSNSIMNNDIRQIRLQHSVLKQPNESYQSIYHKNEDIKDYNSNSNSKPNDVSFSYRSKGIEDCQYQNSQFNNNNISQNEKHKDSLINCLISHLDYNKKQFSNTKNTSNLASNLNINKNNNVNRNINSNNHSNHTSSNSFAHYINQRYDTRSDSHRNHNQHQYQSQNKEEIKQNELSESKVKAKAKENQSPIINDRAKAKENQSPIINDKAKPKQNYSNPDHSPYTSIKHSHHTSSTLHQNQFNNAPITFANNEEVKINKLDSSHNNDDDLESIIYYDDKTSNQNKDSYSTNSTMKQSAISIPKPKNKTRLMENANDIFAEVESFQQQYEAMKQINDQRRNKVNMLLKKKEGHDIQKQFNTNTNTNTNRNINASTIINNCNANHSQSKSLSCMQNNNNHSIKINKNTIYNIEPERNLNEELRKGHYYNSNSNSNSNYNNRTQISRSNNSNGNTRKKNSNIISHKNHNNNSMINLAYHYNNSNSNHNNSNYYKK